MLKRLGSNEPGYSRFDVIQDAGDANRVWVYEVYQDEVAYQAHLRAPHLKKLWDTVKGWLGEELRAKPSSYSIRPTDDGDPLGGNR